MKHLLLAALIGFGAIGCKDRATENPDPGSNPQFPAITQTGANTFGAMINGKVMVPRNSIGYVPPGSNHYAVEYTDSNTHYSIAASNGREYNIGDVYIFLKKNTNGTLLPSGVYQVNEGIYSFNISDLPDSMIRVIFNDNNKTFTTYLSVNNSGNITITRNDNQVISGTFSCKLKNKDNPADIIEVKDGRFDFTKATINTTNFP